MSTLLCINIDNYSVIVRAIYFYYLMHYFRTSPSSTLPCPCSGRDIGRRESDTQEQPEKQTNRVVNLRGFFAGKDGISGGCPTSPTCRYATGRKTKTRRGFPIPRRKKRPLSRRFLAGFPDKHRTSNCTAQTHGVPNFASAHSAFRSDT